MRLTILIPVLLAMLTIHACSGGGGNPGVPLAPSVRIIERQYAEWALLNPGADGPHGLYLQKLDDSGEPGAVSGLDLSFSAMKGGLRVELRAQGEVERQADYRLLFDPRRYSLGSYRRAAAFESRAPGFAVQNSAGVIHLAWCAFEDAPPLETSDVLWTIYLTGADLSQRAASAYYDAPAVTDLTAQLVAGDSVGLDWTALNPGDIDLNGVVTGADLWPLVLNWNLVVEEGDNEKCFDLNDDGTINGQDVFTIAVNYHHRLDGYRVYHSAVSGGPYTELTTAELPVPAPLTGECAGMLAYTDDSPEVGDNFYVVRPFREDTGVAGADSNEAYVELVQEIVHFFEDFELPNFSWTFDNNEFGVDWHYTSVRNRTQGGGQCAGIGDPDGYDYWENDSLVTPAVSLSGTTTPELLFWHVVQTEHNRDGGVVDVSTNGADWTRLTPFGGYPGTRLNPDSEESEGAYAGDGGEIWREQKLDLGDYAGQTVYLRWNFASDLNTHINGWWIDDIKIRESQPVILDALATPATGDNPLDVSFNAQIYGGTEPYEFLWDFNDAGATSDQATPVHTYLNPGVYHPTLLITDAQGFTADFDLLPVQVLDSTPHSLPWVEDFEDGITDWSTEEFGGWGFWQAVTDDDRPPGGLQSIRIYDPESATEEYANFENDNLISRLIDPGDETDIELSFWHKIDAQEGWDGGQVQITTDDHIWSTITPVGGYNGQRLDSEGMAFEAAYTGENDEWALAWFDLSSYAGGEFRIRLNFLSDTSQTAGGWRIDDLRVGTPMPKITAIGATPTEGEDSLIVQFSLTIEDGDQPYTILWDFDDGDTSGDEDPSHLFDAGYFYPEVTVTDDSGLQAFAWAPEINVVDTTPLTPPLLWDFEQGPMNWIGAVEQGWAEWHIFEGADQNHTPGGMNSFKLSQIDGPTYGPDSRAYLYSPVVDLDDQADPQLGFWLDISTEAGNDGLVVDIQVDGGAWTRIAPVGGYPGTRTVPGSTDSEPAFSGEEDYTRYEFDLNTYIGSDCRFRFDFFGDDDYNFGSGVYLDDVYVGNEPIEILYINPNKAAGKASLTVWYPMEFSGGTPPYEFAWEFSDGGTADIEDPYHTYVDDGIYTASVTITDSLGTEGYGASAPVLVGFWHEDFESGQGDWVVTGDGDPTNALWALKEDANHTPGGEDGFFEGDLSTNYGNNNWDTLDSPDISLSGRTSPVLAFWFWLDSEPNWDGGVVFVSDDGGSGWQKINPVGGYPGLRWDPELADGSKEGAFSGADLPWQTAVFDLSGFEDEHIMLRFDFSSDSMVPNYTGWMIDDIVIGEFSTD